MFNVKTRQSNDLLQTIIFIKTTFLLKKTNQNAKI